MKRNSITILRALFLIFGIQILFGKSPTGALKTASFLEKRGEFENAISIYTGILDNDPKNTQAYRKLKTLYKRLEQYPPLLLLIQEHCNLFPNDLQSYGELGDGYNGADAGGAMVVHTANKSELEIEEIDSDIGY